MITETKLPGKEIINIKGYKWIGKNREGKNGGGVGILISDKLHKYTTEDNTSDDYPNLETKWIKLECRPRNIAIGVFYGPQENVATEKIREIYNNLETQINTKRKNNEIILGGDFNAKLHVIKDGQTQKQSRNGKILQDLIDNTQLTPITTKADYGFYTRVNRNDPNEKSMIDYIMTTAPIAKNVSSTIIDEDGAHRVKSKKDSDHNTILISLRINEPRKPEYLEKWKLENKDGWKQFNVSFAKLSENLTRNYEKVEECIRNTLKQTIGKQKIRVDKPPKPKSPAITEARKEKKEAKRKFEEACKSKDPAEKIAKKEQYQKTQRKLREEIEKYEKEATEKRLANLQRRARKDPNTIWQARKKVKRKNDLDYNTITEDDRVITNPEETKTHIEVYFRDLYQARPGTPEYETWTTHISDTVKKITEPRTINTPGQGNETITEVEIKKAIKKLKRKKSLGPDEIPNEVFIESNKKVRDILLKTINNIHSTEEIPPSWLQGEIIRLYKGKGKKGKCSNERGITLASNFGKLYERIINERVKHQVQITDAQAGGIPGSATVDHLIVLKQTLQEITNRKQTAYVVFLDVQKAYDKAWLDAILYVLNKNGVQGKNLNVIKKLNSNLTARIQTRYGLTKEIPIKDSIRQGGVLSVVEYATLIDEISKELRTRKQGVKTKSGSVIDSLLWMDDVCLIHSDRNELQQMLDITNHVAKKYHIEFGAAKCKVVKIGRGPTSKLTLNGQILEEVESYKYLGEMINSKGNLAAHIKELEKKVQAATQTIMSETGNKEFKGIKMEAIWQLVDSIIIPILTYGAEGWDPSKTETQQIQTIMNNTLKTILFLPKQTPTNILLAETGYIPVEKIIKKKRIMQAHRIHNKKGPSLNKTETTHKNSQWRERTIEILAEYKLSEENLSISKNGLSKVLDTLNKENVYQEMKNEASSKTKIRHWMENKENNKGEQRPKYMEKLSRKQCNAIIRTRSSMLPIKTNLKATFKDDLTCRLCGNQDEDQKHVLTECTKNPEKIEIPYEDLFKDDNWEKLKVAAEKIILTSNRMEAIR